MPVSRKRPLKASDERVLHPTRGFRKISVKRTRAALLTQAIFNGSVKAETGSLRRFLQQEV